MDTSTSKNNSPLTGDQAKASLGVATALMQQHLMPKAQEATPEPEVAPQQTETDQADLQATIADTVQKAVKAGLSDIRNEIKKALETDDQTE